MDDQLKSDELTVYKATELAPENIDKEVVRTITETKYDSDCGYDEWLELSTMDGEVFKITERERRGIMSASDGGAKFIELGRNTIAMHQIKGIKVRRRYFGPSAGMA